MSFLSRFTDARKWIGAAPAAFRPYRRPALIERRIAAVLAAVPRVDRAPASAGPRRLAPLRARPAALGVSVGEQQSHYCDTEQNKTDRAHAVLPVHLIPAASSWRTPPSRPRASPRSRASACGLRGARRRASTSTPAPSALPQPS